MFTPIHKALGIDGGELTIELFDRAVEHGVGEKANLDWKRRLHEEDQSGWRDEIAKDFAAMANTGGGWIVFGIKEVRGTGTAEQIEPIPWDAASDDRLRSALIKRITPALTGVEVIKVRSGDDDETFVVVARIPDSQDAPHFIYEEKRRFSVPWRDGATTEFMSEIQIERAFRRRFQAREDEERELQELLERASVYVDHTDEVCLVLVGQPIRRRTVPSPISERAAWDYRAKSIYPDFAPPGRRSEPFEHIGDVRRALRGWMLRSGITGRMVRKSIHDDGSVLAAYRTHYPENRDGTPSPNRPAGLPGHCLTNCLERAIADFATTLRQHAENMDVQGGYRVCADLLGPPDHPLVLRPYQGGGDWMMPEDYSEPIHRFQQVATEMNPLGARDEMLRDLRGLALDIVNQGAVKNLLLLPEPSESE